jgi:hypothetical protein
MGETILNLHRAMKGINNFKTKIICHKWPGRVKKLEKII